MDQSSPPQHLDLLQQWEAVAGNASTGWRGSPSSQQAATAVEQHGARIGALRACKTQRAATFGPPRPSRGAIPRPERNLKHGTIPLPRRLAPGPSTAHAAPAADLALILLRGRRWLRAHPAAPGAREPAGPLLRRRARPLFRSPSSPDPPSLRIPPALRHLGSRRARLATDAICRRAAASRSRCVAAAASRTPAAALRAGAAR